MRVFSEKRIRDSKEKWPHAATDKVGELHVFDIGGNKLRLIAHVRYRHQKLYIKHVLDHREYDRGKWKEGEK